MGNTVIRNWDNSRKLLTGAEAGQEHQRLEEEEGRSRRRHVVNRSVRLASGFTDPAKQEDETTSAWYGSVGLVDAAQEASVPGGLCKSNFPPLEHAEQNNLRSGQQCDVKLTHLIVIMGEEKEYAQPLNRVDSVE